MPILVAVVLFVAAVYLWWRIRYGNPSTNHPPVLCFHKISDRFCWEGTWTTPDRFFAYVDRIGRLGYRFVGMDEYLERIGSSGGAADREVLITFDDGYRELYDIVLPGLEARGIPFHVFLVALSPNFSQCPRPGIWSMASPVSRGEKL